MSEADDLLRKEVHRLTVPINDQYPRPWMTTIDSPSQAKVFIVGFNQASTYTERLINWICPSGHGGYVDRLFSDSKGFYDEVAKISGCGCSNTRKNIERLTKALIDRDVTSVLETNVICYSTQMGSDLTEAPHPGGKKRGKEIFELLVKRIHPEVLIVHGAGARSELNKRPFNWKLKAAGRKTKPHFTTKTVTYNGGNMTVLCIPSLAPPEWNKWAVEATEVFKEISKQTCEILAACPNDASL